jgi:transposase-like protein
MNETFYTCPKCDTENRVLYESDGYRVHEVWLDNDDNGFCCVGCRQNLNADTLYTVASEAAAEARCA